MKCVKDRGSGSPVWLFRDLENAHRLANDKLLDRFEIREFGQPLILFILKRRSCGGFVSTQKELAEELRVSQATVTASLKSLERRGCVRKVCDENDLRRNRIEITDKGREVAEKFHSAMFALDEAMYTDFTQEELQTAASIFKRMTENLLKFAEASPERREMND